MSLFYKNKPEENLYPDLDHPAKEEPKRSLSPTQRRNKAPSRRKRTTTQGHQSFCLNKSSRRSSQDGATSAAPASRWNTTRITSKSLTRMLPNVSCATSSFGLEVSSSLKIKNTTCTFLIMQIWSVLALHDYDLYSWSRSQRLSLREQQQRYLPVQLRCHRSRYDHLLPSRTCAFYRNGTLIRMSGTAIKNLANRVFIWLLDGNIHHLRASLHSQHDFDVLAIPSLRRWLKDRLHLKERLRKSLSPDQQKIHDNPHSGHLGSRAVPHHKIRVHKDRDLRHSRRGLQPHVHRAYSRRHRHASPALLPYTLTHLMHLTLINFKSFIILKG